MAKKERKTACRWFVIVSFRTITNAITQTPNALHAPELKYQTVKLTINPVGEYRCFNGPDKQNKQAN